ncbi:MAG TPA: HAMP domain-containing sensor histidine kinase [Actinomycetota bacterium]|nr:HAMP domain-containing sensor histidine kinase [Actinomycetota bacterium]
MVGRLRAYMAVVSAIGFVVLALLAVSVDLDRMRDSLPAGAMLALVVLVAPFLSIPLSRDGRGPSLHVDTPFVFALVLDAGAGAAALVMAASGLLYDLAHRKPFIKVAFNSGVHTIGLAAGALVWTTLAGGPVTGSSALPAILTGTAVFVVVKMALFGVYLALDESVRPAVSPSRFLRQLLLVVVMAQVGVLVLVLAAERPALLLLALGPMLAAYLLLRSESRAVVARQDAEATARREAELRAQEQEVARKLKETDQMKDDLLAMVSHELRTPLTTVVGALRLLSAGPGLSAGERQEMLEMADRQARRLRVLIEQLLLAAQSDNGRATFLSAAADRVDVDAAELLVEAATEAQAGACGDRVRLRCDQALPVRLTPDPVLQILGNLVDNACKYAPEDSLVLLAGERDGAEAVLAVEDEGAGVPREERERVFERFTRLEPGRGLGLGLYIARQLARAQGGDLVVTDARTTTGARFELRLPLREPAARLQEGSNRGGAAPRPVPQVAAPSRPGSTRSGPRSR